MGSPSGTLSSERKRVKTAHAVSDRLLRAPRALLCARTRHNLINGARGTRRDGLRADHPGEIRQFAWRDELRRGHAGGRWASRRRAALRSARPERDIRSRCFMRPLRRHCPNSASKGLAASANLATVSHTALGRLSKMRNEDLLCRCFQKLLFFFSLPSSSGVADFGRCLSSTVSCAV
eukprot:6187452-Pleurochrysis_carterae.AAC.1